MIKEFLCQTNWLDKALTLVAILAVFLILNIIYVFGRIKKASFDNDDGGIEEHEEQNSIEEQKCNLTKVTERNESVWK